MNEINLLEKIKEELLKEGDSEKAIKIVDRYIKELNNDSKKVCNGYNYSTAFKIATLFDDISVVPRLTQEQYSSLEYKPMMWILSTKEEAEEYIKSVRKLLGILSNLCDGNCQECKFDNCKYFEERNKEN